MYITTRCSYCYTTHLTSLLVVLPTPTLPMPLMSRLLFTLVSAAALLVSLLLLLNMRQKPSLPVLAPPLLSIPPLAWELLFVLPPAVLVTAKALEADGPSLSPLQASSMVKWNVEPSPALLSAHTFPPMSSASCRLMANPNPV